MTRSRPLPVLCAVVVLATTAACGASSAPTSADDVDTAVAPRAVASSETPDTSPTEEPTVTQPDTDAPAPDQPAAVPQELEFTATTLDGTAFDGADLAGTDAVLWFWAPWCVVCRGEAPHVAAVQAAHADDVSFVGVAALAELGEMQDFVSDYEVDAFAHLADPDGTIWQRFGVTHQPAYAFVDDGGSVEVVRGALGEAGLAQLVARLTDD